jgi:hypothetical protein
VVVIRVRADFVVNPDSEACLYGFVHPLAPLLRRDFPDVLEGVAGGRRTDLEVFAEALLARLVLMSLFRGPAIITPYEPGG